jgi:hypothetical protein
MTRYADPAAAGDQVQPGSAGDPAEVMARALRASHCGLMERRGSVTPHLQLNPHGDERFAVVAESVWRLAPRRQPRWSSAEFPRAVVHVRELAGEPWPIWYVYRNGHWVR